MPTPAMEERCTQCNAAGPLLASDDEKGRLTPGGAKPRYCNNCMIGKSVRVFWPVDESWYTGKVKSFNPDTGEHLLKYPDSDEEWIKIGDMRQSQLPPIETGHEEYSAPPTASNTTSPSNRPPPETSSSSNPSVTPGESTTGPAPNQKWPGQEGVALPPMYFPYPHAGMHVGAGGAMAYPINYGAAPPPPGSYPHHPTMGYHMPPITMEKDSNTDASGRQKKQGPKPWSKEEDACLSSLVRTMQWPIKWTMVAQSLAGRTGKQCRERYVNHLNPRLKTSEWSPVEDATIFHLYNTLGSHWAKMSKIIPGRTDNGIKNRFHNIRRQYEREDSHRLRLNSVHDFPDDIRLDRLRKFPDHLSGKATNLWNMQSSVGVLAAQSVKTAVPRDRLGPFVEVTEPTLCVRCGLLVPSVHTGSEICEKTGWCSSCVRVPPNVSGNLLRECLNLRRATEDTRNVIEGWDELFPVNEENAWPYADDKNTDEEKSSS